MLNISRRYIMIVVILLQAITERPVKIKELQVLLRKQLAVAQVPNYFPLTLKACKQTCIWAIMIWKPIRIGLYDLVLFFAMSNSNS